MKKITKQNIKDILGNGSKAQIDIVFALVNLQSNSIASKISNEIEKLDAQEKNDLLKLKEAYATKREDVSTKFLSKTVSDILKKNDIVIAQKEVHYGV